MEGKAQPLSRAKDYGEGGNMSEEGIYQHIRMDRRKFLSLAAVATVGMASGGLAACASAGGAEPTDSAINGLSAKATAENAADMVFYGGIVQTMVKEGDTASAVAIKEDTIVYVGDDAGVEEYVGDATKTIDLAGNMLLPGFMDGHIHAPGEWRDKLFGIYLYDVFTKDEYLERIKEHVTANPDKELYTGAPFMLNAYMNEDGSNPGPRKEDLDAIVADKPIIIYDVSHHSIWTNSAGLAVGGITRDTESPMGGMIAKDENGEPSGYLTDSAMTMVTEKLDLSVTAEQEMEAIRAFQEEANSMGITGITQMAGSLGDVNSGEAYQKLEKEGKLNLRIRIANTIHPGESPEYGVDLVKSTLALDTDLVKGGTAKIFYDGVTESATAVMMDAYLPEAGMGAEWYGEPVWDNEDFNAMVYALDKAGCQIHVHAIGDGAVHYTLNAFEEAQKINGARDARHTMTHVCAIQDSDIPRVADLGVVSALQFLWMYADPLYELEAAFIGEERAMAMYPTKTMWEAGCVISGASDNPVTFYNPLEEIQVGVTRNSPYSGEEDSDLLRAPEEALSAYQMIEAYTKNVAYENFVDDEVGTVEVGKKADLVVLGSNLLEVDAKEIADSPVVYTISNGRIVYSKS